MGPWGGIQSWSARVGFPLLRNLAQESFANTIRDDTAQYSTFNPRPRHQRQRSSFLHAPCCCCCWTGAPSSPVVALVEDRHERASWCCLGVLSLTKRRARNMAMGKCFNPGCAFFSPTEIMRLKFPLLLFVRSCHHLPELKLKL